MASSSPPPASADPADADGLAVRLWHAALPAPLLHALGAEAAPLAACAPNWWVPRAVAEGAQPPGCLFEQAVASLLARCPGLAAALPPAWAGAEVWCQTFAGRGLAHHYDKDERLLVRTGEWRHPAVSCVLYLNTGAECFGGANGGGGGGGGVPLLGPTHVLRQAWDAPSGRAEPATPRACALCWPSPGALFAFPGHLAHGVLEAGPPSSSAAGGEEGEGGRVGAAADEDAPQQPPPALRRTLLVNWWAGRPPEGVERCGEAERRAHGLAGPRAAARGCDGDGCDGGGNGDGGGDGAAAAPVPVPRLRVAAADVAGGPVAVAPLVAAVARRGGGGGGGATAPRAGTPTAAARPHAAVLHHPGSVLWTLEAADGTGAAAALVSDADAARAEGAGGDESGDESGDEGAAGAGTGAGAAEA